MVKTAGDERSVCQHADLVAQAVAELRAGFAGAQVGPVEPACALQIEMVAQAEAAAARFGPAAPGAGTQKGKNPAVARVRAPVVPQPQRNDDALSRGLLGKVPYLRQVRELLLTAFRQPAVDALLKAMIQNAGKEDTGDETR